MSKHAEIIIDTKDGARLVFQPARPAFPAQIAIILQGSIAHARLTRDEVEALHTALNAEVHPSTKHEPEEHHTPARKPPAKP